MRQRNKLNTTAIRKHSKIPGRYSDGGNLYLQTVRHTSGITASWVFRFVSPVTKKQRTMGLGPLIDVGVVEARDEASKLRKMLRAKIDPIEGRRVEQQAAILEAASSMTFEEIMELWFEAHRSKWTKKHADTIKSSLKTHAASLLKLPVQGIDTNNVLQTLEPIWQEKTETATRVRQRIEAVIDYATARKYRSGENPARWKANLDALLPAPSQIQKVVHMESLPYDKVGAFLSNVRGVDGVAAQALELQILTAVRPGEAAGAHVDEFDLKNKLWKIPGERMKAGKGHEVPLSDAASEVVGKRIKEGATGDLFISRFGRKAVTTTAMMKIVRKFEKHIKAHGFRSSFRVWASEQTAYPWEVCEQALAHVIGTKVEKAYNRTTLLERRRRLMNDWSRYCAQIQPKEADNVKPIRQAESA